MSSADRSAASGRSFCSNSRVRVVARRLLACRYGCQPSWWRVNVARLPYASALLLVAGLAMAAPADAQWRGGGWGQPGYGSAIDRARDIGFRTGAEHGERDARNGRRFDFDDSREYRDGDSGFDGRCDRNDYRRTYRESFERGYRDGYARVAQNGWRPGWQDQSRNPRYDSSPNWGISGSIGYGSSGGYGGYGGYGRWNSEATERGYREGFEKGRDDGHDGDRFDPYGEKWYRQGDRGYHREYGSREAYKNAYRDAFRRGYEQGYRERRRW